MYQVGEKFGDYEVVQVLGAGGMGEVYKVRNTLSDRFEAMKVLLPNLQQQADLVDRFMREIKVQATLQHRNIAGLHTAQRQGDKILMFIEFVDGMTLDKPLRRGPLGPELAANIIGQVLDALAYAHARGIVHRDIKPENIMVQPDGVVKLMDFGIARLAQDRKLTSTGRTVGSLYYMSPEQIRGADDLDGRSDLYSLGVTLYECVTGRRPFEGDSDYSIMAAHIQQNPVPPVQLDPQVPAALNDVILMAIAKDRSVRFQSADAFRAALQGSVSGQHTAALPATLVQPQPPSAAYGAPAPSPSPTTPLPPPPPPPLSPPRVPTAVMAQPASPVPAPPPPVLMPGPRPVPASGAKGLIIGLAFLFVAAAGGVAYVKGPEWFGNAGDQKKEEPVQDPGPAVTPPSTAGSTTAGEPGKAATSTPPAVSAPPPKAVPATDDDPRPTQPAVSAAKNRTSTTPPTQQPTSTTAPATSTSTPAATEPPPVASNPAPATPARRTYQVEPPQQQPPQANPQLAREMAEAREKFNSLSIRYSTAQESLRRLEAQQQRQGFGMRRDIREAVTRFQYLMKEATDSMASRNVDAARTSLDMAEKNLDRIEKFLGN